MPPKTPQPPPLLNLCAAMFRLLRRHLRRLSSRLRRRKTKIAIKRFGKPIPKPPSSSSAVAGNSSPATVHPNGEPTGEKSIRVATFNAALFSMAPVASESSHFSGEKIPIFRAKSLTDRPKSILKQSPIHPNCTDTILTRQQKFAKSKLRVSINLPDNEISLLRSRQLGELGSPENGKGKGPVGFSTASFRSCRTVVEVLRELDADVLCLQDVKAEEEKAMKPLSDLAEALGMDYVFAESWAPEYGNAILSKWPIKNWKAQKIFDDSDFRNVLKAKIDVPQTGEINFHCTHLDHLDENWRMKQIDAIIKSSDGPHILAGGLNSLDETDYSSDRWTDIVKYYREMGKPTPKVEVMRFLKGKQYADAKDFAGECESVVMIAKGQSVQGTCKYGTRVDYILASPNSPYKFLEGSYSVVSSKGTSDHHIVKVDLVKAKTSEEDVATRKRREQQHKHKKVVKIKASSSPSKGLWKTHTS